MASIQCQGKQNFSIGSNRSQSFLDGMDPDSYQSNLHYFLLFILSAEFS